MFDINDMRNTPVLGSAMGTKFSYLSAALLLRKNVVVEGRENLPDGPAIFSSNHTHKFDFLPIRFALFKSHRLITWIKTREYNDKASRAFFNHCGNLPLASKGYVISADFIARNGRRPTEEEYRLLREHIDQGEELPDQNLYKDLLNLDRDICGRHFSSSTESYRDAIQATYSAFMTESLALAEKIKLAGHHQQLYPQGAVSSRLTSGKTGSVQAALALDLPIVPMGVSGCIESFYKGSPFSSGKITIKIGKPIYFDFKHEVHAFDQAWEVKHNEYLQKETSDLMNAINELLEPNYQWSDTESSDGKTGIRRFI